MTYGAELAFPELTLQMQNRVARYGKEHSFTAHQPLWALGQRDVDLFVVVDGEIEIVSEDQSGTRRVVGRLRSGQFSGELDLLNSRHTLVSGYTVTACRLLRVPRGALRAMLKAEGDIANLLIQAAIWRRLGLLKAEGSNLMLVGDQASPETLELQKFLLRNGYPHRLVQPESDGGVLCEWLSITKFEFSLPAVAFPDGRVLQRPSTLELAEELGILESVIPKQTLDVIVVGAGPAGLAAAVYASSEGLSTVVIDALGPGGQAGTSSRIENYLGFPTGISGQELATRAQIQAQKFGARLLVSREVCGIEAVGHVKAVLLSDNTSLHASSIVIATGAQYRELSALRGSVSNTRGIHYAATAVEASLASGAHIAVVGGGNSAGQAALFLAGAAKRVHLVVRSSGLELGMSEYLVARIWESDRISVHLDSEVSEVAGAQSVESITWTNQRSETVRECPVTHVFVMIGAEPNSKWLRDSVRLDPKGFVVTGDLVGSKFRYGTSTDGIFAIGDVRDGSLKRVASAVGEGASVVSEVHDYLRTTRHSSTYLSLEAYAAVGQHRTSGTR
jgi:thioredoxin reductase (NADPH)